MPDREVIHIDKLLSPGLVLQIIFRNTMENQRYFADYYIKCDKSLVYKWTNDTVILPKKHVNAIVRFAVEQTRQSERLQITNDIKQALLLSRLCDESRESLLKTEEFGEFLRGALLHAVTNQMERRKKRRAMPENDSPQSLPEERSRLVAIMIFGFFALITGGVLWSCLNRIMGWQYFMGGSGNEPAGLPSFVWGVLSNTPIIVFALVSAGKKTVYAPNVIVILIVSYAILSGLGALSFYNSGLRAYVEQMRIGYGFREGIIAGIYGFAVSGFPALALFFTVKKRTVPLAQRIAGVCLPSFAAALIALSTWIIDRPELEVSQLRGFMIAVALRLFMFITAYRYISGRPLFGRRQLSGLDVSDHTDSTALKSS